MQTPITLGTSLPPAPHFEPGIRRAPKREFKLDRTDTELALRNALRYVPVSLHKELAPEFLHELRTHGRIYGFRYRPEGRIYGKPLGEYKGQCLAGKALQVMIDNNLDFEIALYPYELVTYGETGQVFQNWMQYRLTMQYLEQLTDTQTLVIQSGHPLGVFPSHNEAPRVMTTNGLMVGLFDNPEDFHRAAAIGVANYGQMTAGGWMYIGPQGIVHGTFNTLSIAGRMKLGIPSDKNLAGRLFISSGLGGMSGAQGKAADIAGAVSIIAEIDPSRIETRHRQGWVSRHTADKKEAFEWAQEAQKAGKPLSIAYQGNVIELLQYAVDNKKNVDLLSDQTSCHAVYEGGYCPSGMSFEERTELLNTDKNAFKKLVDSTLQKHYELIKTLTERGTYFFDYGNAFMKAVFDTGLKEIAKNGVDTRQGFIWPSYVEDILGPELFDYGYGPFRWVCLSGKPEDLRKTDHAAADVIAKLKPVLRYQDLDNLKWVREAESYKLVVGTQARILYQDAEGRRQIAKRFNEMVRQGEVGTIMLGRDHHDTGGTDSPFRETSNIKDGSNIMAEMATHIFAGNAARGMTLVALHNGGGVGIGKSINGGFGLVLDGSESTDRIIDRALPWDVLGGVSRRAWAGNAHSIETMEAYNEKASNDPSSVFVTLPHLADQALLSELLNA
ncbi:MAG: urocanate hydratase [Chitinophagaceae bacterium]|nr:urocanate hydratase [Oligoflexus sp.]